MTFNEAKLIIKNTFEDIFSKDNFSKFITNIFKSGLDPATFNRTGFNIKESFRDFIAQYERIGKFTDSDGIELDILIIQLKKTHSIEFARTAQRNFVKWYLNQKQRDAALVAYHTKDSEDWRFSFVKMEYSLEKKKDEITPAKRYSFLVGKNEKSHTAKNQLIGLVQSDNIPTVAEIEESFNIEVVTREFFNKYLNLYEGLSDELGRLINKDKIIKKDFETHNINKDNFAKKLLGQIVFLYFLQKKGWLGVPRNRSWGDGDRHFIRNLFLKCKEEKKNFYNDFLEYLFYEALATPSKGSADTSYYKRFDCRIPFLNGGLFEPLNNYDWRKTNLSLDNSLFSNNDITPEGDNGTGILDVFDRYNFTVNEAEPLEKEVAVDPEMLGKVFENLLGVMERKSKGAFYTPREIVHYMCQQSLTYFLHSKAEEHIKKDVPTLEEIELLVQSSGNIIEDEITTIAKGRETKDYNLKISKSIVNNAEVLDNALAEMKICDPAVGSGAFPVGLLQEVVKIRKLLGTYFRQKPLTDYDLKRHCIQESLYGVDIDSSAVDIAKLRLWLSLVVDEDDFNRIKPLPNLDYKIACGNSLLGMPDDYRSKRMAKIEKLKKEFFEETDHFKKEKLKEEIDSTLQKAFEVSKSSLGYHIDFDIKIYFSEVFSNNSGFDIVIGNPPYVVTSDKILRKIFKESVYGRPNLYGYFIHKAIGFLLNTNGILTFINPKTLLTDSYFQALRKYIIKNSSIRNILNIVDRRNVFEAVLQSCIVNIFSKSKHNIVKVKNVLKKSDVINADYLSVRTNDFIYNESDQMLFIVADNKLSYSLIKKVFSNKSFSENGIEFTTGKIQWDLYKEYLSHIPKKNSTQLIWAENIQRFEFQDARKRSDKIYINTTIDESLIINKPTIIAQRTTAVEQEYRIIAQIINPQIFGFPIQCENHTSYITKNINKINLYFLLGLLNSSLFDFIFRIVNSNTQVSAGELNNLPIVLNDRILVRNISLIVQDIIEQKHQLKNTSDLEAKLNQLVYDLFRLTDKEIKVVEGIK